MTDERVLQTLGDFVEFADLGARLVARGRTSFDADEMLPLAAEAILHKIGETVARLPDDFTAQHPTVRWRPMKGMRNKIAHEYRIIDHELIWSALEQGLPVDAAKIRGILDKS